MLFAKFDGHLLTNFKVIALKNLLAYSLWTRCIIFNSKTTMNICEKNGKLTVLHKLVS